ncbi:hypothetical protein [Burkholderia anthina]|uniref:hypothetical protein n=1 Tax=Burkholderia anthina TaxID=179879 RepID=UPI0037C1A659
MNGSQATCGIENLLKAAPERTGRRGSHARREAGQSSDYRQPAVEIGCEVGYF